LATLRRSLSAARGLAIRDADFELIAESIAHIVWVAAVDGSVEYFNHRGADFTGCRGGRRGLGWLALIHPDDVERAECTWPDAAARDAPYAIEYRLRHHDGTYCWQACRALPVRDERKTVVK
jgi:PAS domain S-box-containing protein